MFNLMKILLNILFGISVTFVSYADTLKLNNVTTHQSGGKYFSYPYLSNTPPLQTPAPIGYKPFHLEHYGRHGSRWHIGYKFYDESYRILNKAYEDGQLTTLGERTYQIIKKIRETAHKGRSGELTDIGALQHQVIARRMVENFPQIFVKNANLNARSTVVTRAILSMHNSLDAIRSLCPNINFSTDASSSDMWYLHNEDEEAQNIQKRVNASILREFKNKHSNNGCFLKKLIKNENYARDSIANRLFTPLFYALVNSQNHSDQPWLIDSIFTPEEVREFWLHGNAEWFIQGGNSTLTSNRMPFSQANLLMNIINSTDSALMSPTPSINLRYGHDSVILPLTVLMEFDDFAIEINDLEDVANKGWHDYSIIPMASNIQMIFYRIPDRIDKKDVLVKVLLNEREVKLPIGNVKGPYYEWELLRDYYIKKIRSYISPNFKQKN